MANPKAQDSLMSDDGNNPLITSQRSNVADASFSDLDTSDTYADAEVNAVFAEVETKINAILDVLEEHGLMADS